MVKKVYTLSLILLVIWFESSNAIVEQISSLPIENILDLPVDENQRLAFHYLLYPHSRLCAGIVEEVWKNTSPRLRIASAVTSAVAEILFNSSNLKDPTLNLFSENSCPAACLERGVQ